MSSASTCGEAPFGNDLRRSTVRERFFRHASHQDPVEWNLEAKYMRDGLAHVCIADWRFGNEARFEIRPDRCHEIHGIGKAEAAVHALTLLQNGIRHFDCAQDRLFA